MKKTTKGFALVTVLVVTILIGLVTAALLPLIMSYSSLKYSGQQEIRAAYLAEAAMQYAIADCKRLGGACNTAQLAVPSNDLTNFPEFYGVPNTITMVKQTSGAFNGLYKIDIEVTAN
ncbi:MAG TPA: type II secretion system protein [Candidatus Omnitrophota bacterium]|nr:type II secretion system protein [Candidatus Omnitrophota bacterium]HPS36417.1 type II secretion system protein [Candidatus Omnitrophota bacterium]